MKKVLIGIVIGISYLIPGLCSASLAISFGVYKDLLELMGSFYRYKIIKKHLLFIIGMMIGLLVGIVLYNLLFDSYSYVFISLFLGFIISGIKKNYDVGFKKINKVICYIIVIIFIILINIIGKNRLNLFSVDNDKLYYFYIFGVAIFASLALVLPGISGSMILFLFGIYDEILKSVKAIITQLLRFQAPTGRFLLVLVIFFIGFIVGLLAFSKIIDKFIETKKEYFIDVTNAFIVGTSLVLFVDVVNLTLFNYKFIMSILFISFGIIISRIMFKRNKKT